MPVAGVLTSYLLVIATSLLAGVGLTALFALAVAAATRAGESRAPGRAAGVAWVVLCLLSLIAVAVLVGAGLRAVAN